MKRAKELFRIFVINFFKALKECITDFKSRMKYKRPVRCIVCGKFDNNDKMMYYGTKGWAISVNHRVLKFAEFKAFKKLKDKSYIISCMQCFEKHKIFYGTQEAKTDCK